MKLVCQYSVARFLPYVETGEFANFGIVLYCPETGFFGYKLLTKGAGRITAFFKELDPVVFQRARQTLKDELVRLQERLTVPRLETVLPKHSFLAELTRPRESIIRFGETRAIMTNDPASEVDRLFDHYVRRAFVTTEYKDLLVEKAVRQILAHAGVEKDFVEAKLAGGGYHATFPFVKRRDDVVQQIIKPLHLGHGNGTQIFNHAWLWVGKIQRLRQLKVLPSQILVPIKAPAEQDTETFEQYEAACDRLTEIGAQVVAAEDAKAIAEFARK
ncbi:MAG TPA: DUF3037 domain-containing protein [Dongiaceae bacterium]|nr:DUF3037 domain-containing protein [Dongiaceae bacterium]